MFKDTQITSKKYRESFLTLVIDIPHKRVSWALLSAVVSD